MLTEKIQGKVLAASFFATEDKDNVLFVFGADTKIAAWVGICDQSSASPPPLERSQQHKTFTSRPHHRRCRNGGGEAEDWEKAADWECRELKVTSLQTSSTRQGLKHPNGRQSSWKRSPPLAAASHLIRKRSSPLAAASHPRGGRQGQRTLQAWMERRKQRGGKPLRGRRGGRF